MPMYNRSLPIAAVLISIWLITGVHTHAAIAGKADLTIQYQNPPIDGSLPQPGDILNLALTINAQNENITGVVVYLTLDEEYFDIIPARSFAAISFPFHQGDWLKGVTSMNGTLGDKLSDSMANQRTGFQLVYNEDRVRGFGGEEREGVSGKGVLAEMQVRLLKSHPNPLEAITYEAVSPTGSESGYFHKNYPGIVYALNYSTETGVLGDFNGDKRCDFNDFVDFIQHYGTTPDQRGYLSRHDLDGNGEIGFGDFLIFSQAFGK